MSIPRVNEPLGKPSPYIIPAYEGESITIPGTRSSIRILASQAETDNLLSVFNMDGTTGDPVGFHYHDYAHDVFMCTRGSMKLQLGDKCKILRAGDFGYAPPKVVHSPQLMDGVTETIGCVTPGDWVNFFRFVCEKYDGVIGDEFDKRNTGAHFGSKIMEIKAKYDVQFVRDHVAAEVSEFDAEDSKLPDSPAAYFLKADTGPAYLLEGVLARPFITTKQTAHPTGNFAVASIEGSSKLPNSILSKPFTFEKVHQAFYVMTGAISIKVNGGEANLVRVGETAFIPAGTEVSIEFVDRYSRFWSFSSGDGLETLISEAGGAYEGKILPEQHQVRKTDADAIRKTAEKLNLKISI
ncbi:RmlC-like cupin [Dothidotthia symphoricarpi CBS 119687]|uniref:RmlC-like cupin n=1 Tax=Dothidotthia symphoricarpi CBS 119687 TaxID=1392245 RepID=A0A6A6AIN9_9PLEO|nr:RmlC-like cupin [Dothidotthia symphoricarpi CBS 119687]KAF2130777.1 RmlC-like cupin [Dothidotthia symphoricarpi CBS 119687]